MAQSSSSYALFTAKLLVSLAALVYLFYHLHITPPTVEVRQWLPLLPISMAIVVSATAIMAYRWHLLLRSANAMPYPNCFKGYCIGMLFNLITPGSIGGDVARIAYAQLQHPLPLKQALGIILQERLTGIFAIAIFMACALSLQPWPAIDLPYQRSTLEGLYCLMLIAMIMSMVLIHRHWAHLPIKTFITTLALSMLAQMGDILIAMLALHHLEHPLSLPALCLVMPLVYLASVLPISLGGLGVREGVFATLLATLYHIPLSMAICVGFLTYIAKAWVSLIIGLPLLIQSPLNWTNIKALYEKTH